jgi:hypothetical protein
VAGRTPSSSLSSRNVFADAFAARLIVLGAAALGFLVTFLMFDHEIHSVTNVVFPLLFIVPSYLLLMSLNTWWAAKLALQVEPPSWSTKELRARTRSAALVWRMVIGMVFGGLAALVYVHSVR